MDSSPFVFYSVQSNAKITSAIMRDIDRYAEGLAFILVIGFRCG